MFTPKVTLLARLGWSGAAKVPFADALATWRLARFTPGQTDCRIREGVRGWRFIDSPASSSATIHAAALKTLAGGR
jgi:hypothetical protein